MPRLPAHRLGVGRSLTLAAARAGTVLLVLFSAVRADADYNPNHL